MDTFVKTGKLFFDGPLPDWDVSLFDFDADLFQLAFDAPELAQKPRRMRPEVGHDEKLEEASDEDRSAEV